MLTNKKAVSTIILIILILCSAVFGALVSYLWVMGNYYNMPEDTTLLIVTNVVFPSPPTIDLTYFNVTILNLSNSISDVNITAVRLSVEGKNEVYNITATDPEPLPFLLRRGTEHTFKCKKNWSNFAGETVRIEPVAANTSTKSYSYITPRVKLDLIPNFDERSVEYFDLTIENLAESIINLTISEIMVNYELINENVTPSLTPPHVLAPGQLETFRCNWNWDWAKVGIQNVTITVKTAEGYESVYITNETSGAIIYIDEIRFDYTDTSYFNLTVSSSENSTIIAKLNRVNLTLENETPITLNTTYPTNINKVPIPLVGNQSLPIKCLWDWNEHRNKTITVNLYTEQSFTAPSISVKTPSDIVWNITDVKFDFDDLEHFFVNVTNMPCSLHEINVTKILLDENETIINPPATIQPGEPKVINCTLPWKDWINKTVTINVFTETSLNVSKLTKLPPVELKLLGDELVFGDLRDQNTNRTIPYVNVTISNSINSLQNVTIIKIIFETQNGTYEIDTTLTYPQLAPNGYILITGENITITCPWNWGLYLWPYPIKVTVYTFEGIQASRTWYPQIP